MLPWRSLSARKSAATVDFAAWSIPAGSTRFPEEAEDVAGAAGAAEEAEEEEEEEEEEEAAAEPGWTHMRKGRLMIFSTWMR